MKFRMMAAVLAVPACLSVAAPAQARDTFHCVAGDMTYSVTIDPRTPEFVEVDVSVGEQMDQSLARKFDLPEKQSGSGFRYENDGVEFRGKGEDAFITVLGETFDCELDRASGAGQTHDSGAVGGSEGPEINMPGRSYGGKLRDGPGMNFRQVGSLGYGNRLTIVRNTGVEMNGYDWFEVRVRSRTAYQWGGILCSNAPVDGIYKACSEDF